MAEPKLDPAIPPGLYLISAFLSMEPTETLLSLSRECGGGLVTEGVQRFIWEHCISNEAGEKGYGPYLKNFLKKLISEVESRNGTVLDELYEQCGYYMSSLKDNGLVKGSARVCKCISFLFPDACELPSCPKSSNLVVQLHCSLNMLEGDTGCSVWPSSLFLSEFVLSFPDIFSNKSCFEVGSGVGLVGICLSHVKASQVILSDGDLSTLSNMKINLELNQLSAETNVLERFGEDPNTQVKADMDNKSTVKCFHLPWESATESELQEYLPDIILGADIIYDPSCLPHLVRVLGILLKQKKACSQTREESCKGQFQEAKHIGVNGASEGKSLFAYDLHGSECITIQKRNGIDPRQAVELNGGSSVARLKKCPVAYIASVIRNIDTFNCFLKLAEAANLEIADITEALVPRLLRSSVTFSQAAIVAFFNSLSYGGLQASLMYYLKARFHFSKNQYAELMILLGVSGMASQLLIMPFVAPRVAEEKLLAIGLLGGIANALLYSVAWSTWVPYASTIFSVFEVFVSPCLRSIVSKQIGPNEQGKAQGCISGIISLANIISPLVYSPLTALFLSEDAPFNFPGFIFLCIGFATMIAFFQSVLIRAVPPVSSHKSSSCILA